jgi:hypothetical protein
MGLKLATSADLPQPAAAGIAYDPANLPAILDDISPPPLDRDEAAGPYQALLAHFIAEVKPHGIVEHVWVRDYVDRAAEVVRLRTHKADMVKASAAEGVRAVLRDLGVEDYFTLAKRWHARDPDAVAAVEATLAAANLGLGVVRAQALRACIGDLEKIDRMLHRAELRRDEMLRQLYHHQAALAERLRNATAAHEQQFGGQQIDLRQIDLQAQEIENEIENEIEIHPSPVQTGQYVEASG